jgi:NADPH:quinone reductase
MSPSSDPDASKTNSSIESQRSAVQSPVSFLHALQQRTITMSSQKAIAVVAVGKPVELIERPIPKPGPGQILVKVSIAGINPHDGIIREWAYFIGAENLPGVLAIDITGEVVELGSGVSSFKIGDKVMGQGNPSVRFSVELLIRAHRYSQVPDASGTQEYTLLEAEFVCRLPKTINEDEAGK